MSISLSSFFFLPSSSSFTFRTEEIIWCLSFSDRLISLKARCPRGPSMLLQLARFHPLLWLNSIPPPVCACVCLCTPRFILTMPKPLTMWITTNWKIVKEMRIPDHLTFLLRNLYTGQEATVTTDITTHLLEWPKSGTLWQQILARMWNDENSHTLLLGMQNDAATLEDSLVVYYKTKLILV